MSAGVVSFPPNIGAANPHPYAWVTDAHEIITKEERFKPGRDQLFFSKKPSGRTEGLLK